VHQGMLAGVAAVTSADIYSRKVSYLTAQPPKAMHASRHAPRSAQEQAAHAADEEQIAVKQSACTALRATLQALGAPT
jgi:hypothetical protein